MTKIKLSLESLRVESFATCAAEGGLGTVHGNAKTFDQDTCGAECQTRYGVGVCSLDDGCNSAPHGYTPCGGCVETDLCTMPEACMIEVGVLEG